MRLEEYIAAINKLAFWREFTFAQNKFSPLPGKEFELADNFVWLGNHAFVIQMKERSGETNNFEAERRWFKKKIITKATSQIRDTLNFMKSNKDISIINERGHKFNIRPNEISFIISIIIYVGGKNLPEECRATRYHVSKTSGFIHVIEAQDYLGVLETLRVPYDIQRYFSYREEILPKLNPNIKIIESDIMAAFLLGEINPTSQSHLALKDFFQDLDSFDISFLISNLHNHIIYSGDPYDYYEIMLEFSKIPRSVWREIKARFTKSFEAVQRKEFSLPYRLAYPSNDCSFMIASLDPQMQEIGKEGDGIRAIGLQNLTYGAMYDTRSSKGIGILISKSGEYLQIDWCLINAPFEYDQEMEDSLKNAYPFREAKEKELYSFKFFEGS